MADEKQDNMTEEYADSSYAYAYSSLFLNKGI